MRACMWTRQRTLSPVRAYKSIAYATRRRRVSEGSDIRGRARVPFYSRGLRDIARISADSAQRFGYPTSRLLGSGEFSRLKIVYAARSVARARAEEDLRRRTVTEYHRLVSGRFRY